jgi:hypothetical protein
MYIKWCTGSSIVIRYLKRAFWCALGTHVLCGAILAQDRPNVLIIYSDEGLESPDVDLLAAEGIEWNHFLGYGNPALDMAAILAGKYPLRLGVRGQWYREGAIDEEEVLLSEVFRAQGYTTAFFGSWYHGGQFPQTPGAQGFDSYFGHSLLPTGITPSGCPIYPQPGKNDLLALHLLDWLAIPRQNPFFAVAALEERAAFQIARTPVGRLVEKPNHSKGIVRQIMDRLDELMLREQTIVVLVGLPGNNALPIGYPVEGRGIVLWRGFLTSARLPYPAVPMDIFPTVAGLCQISVPEGLYIDGIHLNAIMQGAPDHTDGRPLFFNYADRGLRPFPGMAMWKSRWLELANGTDTAGFVPDFLLSDRVWSERGGDGLLVAKRLLGMVSGTRGIFWYPCGTGAVRSGYGLYCSRSVSAEFARITGGNSGRAAHRSNRYPDLGTPGLQGRYYGG